MPEPITIPAEPDWWRARDRDGALWYREPNDGGNAWVAAGVLEAYEWEWAEAWTLFGPFTCADDEAVDRG